jgi:predicted O-linked N-acetylglucosamine transferase (SPINDLY family)
VCVCGGGRSCFFNFFVNARAQAQLSVGYAQNGTPLAADRIHYYSVSDEDDMMALYGAADVVLDTFPVGGYITSLQVSEQACSIVCSVSG